MATEPNKVIVEKTGSSAWLAIIAMILIALLAVGGFALVSSENHKDNAVAGAAEQVGDAAQDVGDAAKDVAK